MLMAEMMFTLTMEVEYPDLESPDYLINPQQKVMVAETSEGITLSLINNEDNRTLKRWVSTNKFRIRAKDEHEKEWDVISTGFGNSLKLKGNKRDNDTNQDVIVMREAEDDGYTFWEKVVCVPKATSDNSKRKLPNFMRSKTTRTESGSAVISTGPGGDQNDYRPKYIFMLLKAIFLLAIVTASVVFYYKKEHILNDKILSWYIFSSLAIITIGSMVYDYLFTETMNKTWTMLAHLSLFLGLFLLSLMYISYWPVSTYGIYLPFFIAPVFLTFHDTSTIPSYIKKLSEITGLDGAEYYLPFVLIYRMALMIVVLLMASKLEGEFSARWWTIWIIFGTARSIYLILVWYSLWNHNIPNTNDDNSSDSQYYIRGASILYLLHSPQYYFRVYTLLNILSYVALMIFGTFVSLTLDEIWD
jgi:hypothetical protein